MNLQDCREGAGCLSFALNDTSSWEHLLPGEPLHMRVLPEIGEEEQIDIRQQEKHLDMPDSWVEKLVLSDGGM